MSLSCYCPTDYDADWYWDTPEDFTTLRSPIRKRCCSCKELIEIDAECLEFMRWRDAISDIEERIYGDQRYLASWYMCESCGEQFLNLTALGYCISLGEDNMEDLLKEYQEQTGFVKDEDG